MELHRDDSKEWLITDPKGAFAMGTRFGIRTRKYHGFYMGLAGRTETAFLSDFEMECDGEVICPHSYASAEGQVLYPMPGQGFAFESTDAGPSWRWTLPKGELRFEIHRNEAGGLRFAWSWLSPTKSEASLRIRPFFGMRNLHSLGGRTWSFDWVDQSQGRFRIPSSQLHGVLDGALQWVPDETWYWNFHYPEEKVRGYDSEEHLFSAGFLATRLRSGASTGFVLSLEAVATAADSIRRGSSRRTSRPRPAPVQDFALVRPAGIAAGYPWFGEWGRDTFVALPGIAASMLDSGVGFTEVWSWAEEVLMRWGKWIDTDGMLPNVLTVQEGRSGQPQWESSDATLWWCHALAGLWSLSLRPPFPFPDITERFDKHLATAIHAIRSGRHRFLREREDGLLEVSASAPFSTWMDARVQGEPVTPRTGALPEINALWFQARCLHWLWAKNPDSLPDAARELAVLARSALDCGETDRPNRVFLHSIPLAPSFALKDWNTMAADFRKLTEKFRTPVGLRTLSPEAGQYQPRCEGEQARRDQTYHQGPAWAWLGGHYEMVRQRLAAAGAAVPVEEEMFTRERREQMPIQGHVPELFDAEAPFTPRGAPAQAWSLACIEEARLRAKKRSDLKLTQILAQRWLGREQRESRATGASRARRRKPEPERPAE